MRVAKAGVINIVFAVGWILGPIRELWAVPRFGRVMALLCEAIIILIVMFVADRWVMRRFNLPPTLGSTIPMGLVAFATLVPAEWAGVLWVRGFSIRVSGELRDRSRLYLTGHVRAVWGDAHPPR
jgi:hypothetical protein